MKIKKKQVVVNETIHTTEYVGDEINENCNTMWKLKMDMYQKREVRKNKKMNEDTKSLPSTSINW